MKTLIVNGIVCSEPQIKVSTNGTTFVEFRMVNHDDKKEDFWFTCRSSQGNIVSLAKKFIKKGTRLIVSGAYSNEIYVNNKQEATVSNNLWLTEASFVNDGNGNNNNGNAQKGEASDMDNMTSDTPAPEAQKPEAPAPEQPESKGDKRGKKVEVEDVPADDLPF